MARKLPPTQFVQAVLRSFMADSGLEPRLFGPHLTVTDASAGKVNFKLAITNDHLNRLETLHGGTLASLVDVCGSLAVSSTGRWTTGVSTDLNVTYIKPAGVKGQVLFGSATCDQLGKNLAYTSVAFWNQKCDVTARGSHTKFLGGQTPDPQSLYMVEEKWLTEDDKKTDGRTVEDKK